MSEEQVNVGFYATSDSNLNKYNKASEKQFMATDKALNSYIGSTHKSDAAHKKHMGSVAGSNRTMMNSYRSYSLMPPAIQGINGAMIELSITMATFAAAASPFYLLTKTALDFNSTLENTRIGIASVITMTSDYVDAQGNVADGAMAFNLAQEDAIRLQDKLRTKALTTAATFGQLTEAFQNALAPGLSGGMTPDQVLDITVRVAQAAKAIDVPMRQLNEEIRSLLSGNITMDSRLAKTLQLTKVQIDQAKDSAGGLFGFLQEKLGSFAHAEKAMAMTFDALSANTIGAMQMAIGQGLEPYTDYLKTILIDVQKSILVFNEFGDVTGVNPEFKESLRGISDGLITFTKGIISAIDAVKALKDAIGFEGIAGGLLLLSKSFRTGVADAGRFALSLGSLGGEMQTVRKLMPDPDSTTGRLKMMTVPVETISSWTSLKGQIGGVVAALAPLAAFEGALKIFELGGIVGDIIKTNNESAALTGKSLSANYRILLRQKKELEKLGITDLTRNLEYRKDLDKQRELFILLNKEKKKFASTSIAPTKKEAVKKDDGYTRKTKDGGLTPEEKKANERAAKQLERNNMILSKEAEFRKKMEDMATGASLSGIALQEHNNQIWEENAQVNALSRYDIEIKAGMDRVEAMQHLDDLQTSIQVIGDEKRKALKEQAMSDMFSAQESLQADFSNLVNGKQQTDLRQLTSNLVKYNKSIEKMDTESWKNKFAIASGAMKMMASLMSDGSKRQFEIGKALAKASVIVDTSMGVMKAWGQGGMFGGISAALIAAAGAMNLVKINATEFGGGTSVAGSGAGGGGAPSYLDTFSAPSVSSQADTTPQAPAQTVIQVINQGNVMTPEFMTDVVIPSLQDAMTNSDVILVSPGSAQASVLQGQ